MMTWETSKLEPRATSTRDPSCLTPKRWQSSPMKWSLSKICSRTTWSNSNLKKNSNKMKSRVWSKNTPSYAWMLVSWTLNSRIVSKGRIVKCISRSLRRTLWTSSMSQLLPWCPTSQASFKIAARTPKGSTTSMLHTTCKTWTTLMHSVTRI